MTEAVNRSNIFSRIQHALLVTHLDNERVEGKSGAMATNEAAATSAATASTPPNPANLITALTTAFKLQSGEAASGARIAQLLEQNMGHLGELMRQGKLTAAQIQQVRLLVNQVRFLYLTGASYL